MTLHIGFTGTRHGMSAPQHRAVWNLVSTLYNASHTTQIVGHHGDCVGADAEFHAIVRFHIAARVVIHPGPVGELSAGCEGDERLDPLPHMRRNRAIVEVSSVVIAAPFEDTEQERGGTWATIRMARKAARMLYVIGREGQRL